MGFLTDLFKKKEVEKEPDNRNSNRDNGKNGSQSGSQNNAPNGILENEAAQLGYPYTVLADLNLGQVMTKYVEALERGKREGFCPVLVAEDSCLDEYFGIMRDDGYNLEDTLKKIGDGREFLGRIYKELTEPGEDCEAIEFSQEFLGEIEEYMPINEFSALKEYGTKKVKRCALVELPTDKPWEVVAYVPFGGWNDCPMPEDMAAVCKLWYEKYGAVPATITHDTLEFYVEYPVDEDVAMELAKEHYLFCMDRVDQCARNVADVAASLIGAKVWYFWWD